MSGGATVVGAGSVGLALAARLALGGVRVLVVTRRFEAARLLAERGLEAEDPASGARRGCAVRASCVPAAIDPAAGPIFVCTRVDGVAAVARALAGRVAALVTFQNDVVSEEAAAPFVPRVIGGVWRETATRVADDRVRYALERPGRAILGLHPSGSHPDVEAAAAVLRLGGIDVSVSPAIGRDKWLKLCVNLMSTPNALVRRPDHTAPAFVEVKVRLLEEARAALSAAGIDATPCDGRDRTLDAEIAFQREALARGASARHIPLYNQVWTGLRHGAPLEADAYHERILALARQHGTAAPVNALVLARLLDAARNNRGPECSSARELLPDRGRPLESGPGQQLERFRLAGAEDQVGHAGALPRGHARADAVGRADQRDLVDQLVGHRRHRLHLLAVEVEVLDLLRLGLVAEPLGVVVVEVLVARAHAADVEREHALHRHAAALEVVADDAR